MLTKNDAYSLVEAEFTQYESDGDPVILKAETLEYSWGWVVFYQSKKYIETNDIRYALAGNAPYIVNRQTGEIELTGTALPVEEYIREYETRIAEN